jgi:hypothetical protein
MVQTANTIWRDFNTDGVPSSEEYDPKKADIRAWGTWVESIITAFTSNGGLIYSSKAAMDADLAHGANSMAWVIGDPDAANNGVYGKLGASGAGSWTRRSDLPFSFIIASDAGAGTPNAIQATTSIPVSGSALIWMNVADTNTGTPVTVSFNGGSPLTIKTNSGNDVAAGGLTAGMIVMGIVSGSTFRLVSDQASAAIVAAAEAYANAAAAAANAGFVFDTEADFEGANIPPVLQFVRTAGYYAPGDGGGHLKQRVATPSVIEPWHKQSADGAWWIIAKQHLDVRMFGARIDSATDDAAAINAGVRLSALYGVEVFQPAGTSMQGATITLPHGAAWVGFNYLSTVKKLPTFNGVAVQSENFATLTGTGDAFAPSVPERICAKYITLDGNYQNSARDAYIQTGGQGVRIFARKAQLHLRVFNMQGVGVWIEGPGGNGPTPLQPGFSREADIDLFIHGTQYEGLVWKGLPDVLVKSILQVEAGYRISSEENNGKVNSPTYGSTNGNQTFGIVIDGIGAEFQFIHTFGNFAGGGIDIRGAPRINIDLLIVETCRFGGFIISGTARGTINRLDIHRTGGFGGDTTEDFIYETSGTDQTAFKFGMITIYRNNPAYTTARNATRIDGDFFNCGVLEIEMDALAGHGLVINYNTAQWVNIGTVSIARCQGVAPGGLSSSAIWRNGSGNGSSIFIGGGLVRDCSVALRSNGAPRVEKLNFLVFLGAGQSIFAGDAAANDGQKWDISGTVDSAYSELKSDNRLILREAPTLTISAGGAVTVGFYSYYPIDTNGGAPTDDLDTINSGTVGQIIVLRAANSTRDVVVTEAGNIRLSSAGSTFTLNNSQDRIVLQYDGTVWNEIARSDNSA